MKDGKFLPFVPTASFQELRLRFGQTPHVNSRPKLPKEPLPLSGEAFRLMVKTVKASNKL